MNDSNEHDHITHIKVSLGRIEEKLDGYKQTQEKHDTRISDVEKKVWIGSGLAIGLGALWELIKSKSINPQ